MQTQLSKLKSCVEQNRIEDGLAIVQECKIARLTQSAVSDAEYQSVLESAVLLCVADQNLETMGRQMQQYLSHCDTSPSSLQPSPLMLSLHLLALLVQHIDAEFHTQLEQRLSRSDESLAQDPLVQFPITLERKLMVGMYDQILTLEPPHPALTWLVETLRTTTVREAICDTLEVSYEKLTMEQAGKLIGVGSDVVASYVAEEREDWLVDENTITFSPPTMGGAAYNHDPETILTTAEQWMQQTLQYAGEMEQIV